jgi:hypothetical protein
MSQNLTVISNFSSPQDPITPFDLAVKYYPYIIGTIGLLIGVYGVWDKWFPKAVTENSDAYIDHSSSRRFENHKVVFSHAFSG